jgi:hypothetical protein
MIDLALLVTVPGTVVLAIIIDLLALMGWVGRQWSVPPLPYSVRHVAHSGDGVILLRGDPSQLPPECAPA